MISDKMRPLVANNSAIRQMFEEGLRLAQEYGPENVFDFSIGNPNVPPPDSVKEAIIDVLNNMDPIKVHGYMSNAGFPETRRAIAGNLNKRFGTSYTEKNIIMTVGAASAMNVILKTILNSGEEVICFAPYFFEYGNYIRNHDGVLTVVSANPEGGFMPKLDELEEKITANTKAVIINNPNNPTGVIYPEEVIKELLKAAEEITQLYKNGKKQYLVTSKCDRSNSKCCDLAVLGNDVYILVNEFNDINVSNEITTKDRVYKNKNVLYDLKQGVGVCSMDIAVTSKGDVYCSGFQKDGKTKYYIWKNGKVLYTPNSITNNSLVILE